MTSRTPTPRLAALDGLRGAAAATIVVHHAWMFDHGDGHSGVMTLLDFSMDELRLGVALFFVLSGYLVFRPFVAAALDGRERPSFRAYARRRAARILPGYWLVLAGSFVLLAAIEHPLRVSAEQLPLFLAFAQNQVTATQGHLDPPMWTLAIEACFYALVPLVALATARLGTRRGGHLALCGGLAAAGLAFCALAAFVAWPRTVTNSLATTLPLFACGMTVATLAHRRTIQTRTGVAMILAGVALVLASAVGESAATIAAGPLRTAVCDVPAAAGFALIVGAFVSAPLRARVLTSAPLLAAGTLSYGLYLWHFPVIYALRAAGAWPSDLVLAMSATLAGATVLAALSWFALERPVLRWSQRAIIDAAPSRLPARRWTARFTNSSATTSSSKPVATTLT